MVTRYPNIWRKRLVVLVHVAAATLSGLAHATPVQIAVQGRLTAAGGGAATDGTYPLAIGIYDAATGGSQLFKELFLAVPVQGGVFALAIGGGDVLLDSAVFAEGKQRFVGVTVGGEAELARQPLRQVPMAVQAAVAADLQCSGCVGTADIAPAAVTSDRLADSAVTSAKIAANAVQSSHVNFNWAAADQPGGVANFALAANSAKQADTAAFADEAGSAKLATQAKSADSATTAAVASALKCTGCIGIDAIAPEAPAQWVAAGKLHKVALSGQFSDLNGGPDLSGYAALSGANSFTQTQTWQAGGKLGGALDFALNQAQLFRFQNADKAPATCDGKAVGLAYYDTSKQALMVCNGTTFKAFATAALTGTQANPAASCKAVLDAGDSSGNGKYWLKRGDGVAYQGTCLMDTEGGGWTRLLNMTDAASFKAISSTAAAVEFVDNGTWQFSTAMMKASNRELLIVETVAPFRMHKYDFKMGSNVAGDNFVGAVTGDVNASVGVFNWQTNQYETMAAGKCNNNNHTQWNCEPPGGVRFHIATRDWTGDGGGSYGNGDWGFTGYATTAGSYTPVNLPKYVKNWNGQYNATAHDIYFR